MRQWIAALACTGVLSAVSQAQTGQILPTRSPALTQTAAAADLPEAPRPAFVPRTEPHTANDAADSRSSTGDDDLSIKGTPLRILRDELGVITSPARVRTHDLRWLLPLAGASAAAFATDVRTNRDVVSHNVDFNNAGQTSSDVLRGIAIGVPVALFGLGELRGAEHPRETGLLAGEAIIDAYVLSEGVKYITLRERPYINNGRGSFFSGDAVSDPSFVSGHAVVAWSSAAVLAAEYSRPWQQGLIYTLATGASLTRVLGQQHFPSDALLGSAMGWFVGHYVYRAHHRHASH